MMKGGYKDSGKGAKGNNEKYMSKGMNLQDGTQASAPKKCTYLWDRVFPKLRRSEAEIWVIQAKRLTINIRNIRGCDDSTDWGNS
jgi:hypothetical protein